MSTVEIEAPVFHPDDVQHPSRLLEWKCAATEECRLNRQTTYYRDEEMDVSPSNPLD